MAKDKVELKISIGDYIYLPIEKLTRTRYNFKQGAFEQRSVHRYDSEWQTLPDWSPVEPTTEMHNFVVDYMIDIINARFGAKK
jgi:hypothetical protein